MAREPAGERLFLAVDGGGALLVCTGSSLVLGHRAAPVELPFLADVGPAHARLEATDGLREGPGWSLVAREPVRRNGIELQPGRPAPLRDGDRLRLGVNLELRFRIPDPASSCALLVARGALCLGAARIALLRPGPAGGLRIAEGPRAHVRSPRAGEGVELALEERELVLRSALPLALGAGEPTPELRLPWPLAGPACATSAEHAAGRGPFSLSLTPLGPPGARPREPGPTDS